MWNLKNRAKYIAKQKQTYGYRKQVITSREREGGRGTERVCNLDTQTTMCKIDKQPKYIL